MTVGTIDSKHPAAVLAEYRARSHPVLLEQAAKFKSLSPVDQRELLFHMLAHATIAISKLTAQMEQPCPKK